MRSFILLFLAIITSVSCYSKNFIIAGTDNSEYPLMKAYFYAFDEEGNRITDVDITDFTIKEFKEERQVLSVSCPGFEKPDPISSVLVMDASGSMNTFGNLDLARNGAKLWVNRMDLEESECALTVFSTRNFLITDFTNDEDLLYSGIDFLYSGGMTNYNAAFVKREAGGLIIAEHGQKKKVIVMLTDGQPTDRPDEAAIIAEAKRQNAKIYCLVLKMRAPESLRNIAEATGGKCFEYIKNEYDITAAYMKILMESEDIEPCVLQWQSEHDCSQIIDTEISFRDEETIEFEYTIGKDDLAHLSCFPETLTFNDVPPGESVTKEVEITAVHDDFDIFNILSNSSLFEITPTDFKIKRGETKKVKITFSPTDSLYILSKFDLHALPCEQELRVSGGIIRTPSMKPTVRITRPNGKEVFIPGFSEEITWEGVTAETPVRLLYSVDKGDTWSVISDSTTGLSYLWEDIPMPVSEECLMKVDPQNLDSIVTVGSIEDYRFNDIEWSPGGNYLAGTSNQYLSVFDAETLTPLSIAENIGNKIKWSEHPDRLYCISNQKISAIDYPFQEVAQTYTPTGDRDIRSGAVSADGTKFAVSYYERVDNQNKYGLEILDLTNWTVQREIEDVYAGEKMLWSSDNKYLFYMEGSTREIRMYDVENDTIYKSFLTKYASDYDLSSNDSLLIVSAENKIFCYDVESGDIIDSVFHMNTVASIRFMNNDSEVFIYSNRPDLSYLDLLENKIYPILSNMGQLSPQSLHPTEYKVAYGYTNYLKYFDFGATLNIDESDEVWYIREPELSCLDVDMGDVLVGKQKDSTVTAYLRNEGLYDAIITDIRVSGLDSLDYSVVTGSFPDTLKWHKDYEYQISFTPRAEGKRISDVIFTTKTGEIRSLLDGRGVLPDIELKTGQLSFGKVNIGMYKDSTSVLALKNVGNEIVRFTSVTLKGLKKEAFELSSGPDAFTLRPGDEHLIDVRFSPAELGRVSAILEYVCDDPVSPLMIQLFGEGVDESGIETETAGELSLICEDTIQDTVKIKNTGPIELVISNMELRENNLNYFDAATNHPDTIAAGGTLLVPYVFTPLVAGEFEAELYMETESETAPQYSVKLKGRKDEITMSSGKDEYDFASNLPGTSVDSVIMIKNEGTIKAGFHINETSVFSCDKYDFALNADETTGVRVTLNDNQTQRDFAETLIISDTLCNAVIEVPLKGSIESYSDLSVKSVDSGELICGQGDTLNYTATNSGGKLLTISGIQFEGEDASDFSVLTSLPIQISTGNSAEFEVAFLPKGVGEKECTLIIESDAPDSPYEKAISARKDSINFETSSYAIDLGMLCPGETLDTALSVTFFGTISADLAIEPSSDKITVAEELSGEPGTSEELIFSYTAPETDADIDELITVTDPICGKEIDVLITGKVVLPVIEADDYTFTSYSGDSETIDIEIKNTSERDVIIESCPGVAVPFSLVGNPFPLAIAAGESGIIQIEYSPTDENPASVQISFEGSPCSVKKQITLSGNSVSAELVLKTGIFEAYTADKLSIPITIEKSVNMENSDITQMSCELTFNHTLLYPTGFAFTPVNESTAFVSLDLDVSSFETGKKVAELEFDVALGNAVGCDLELRNFTHDGKPINIIAAPGKFSLLGICEEGGTRLVNPGETVGIKGINPNPAGNEINISLGLIESGYTELAIYNSRGERVATLLSENVESYGERKIKADVSELSSGLYMIVLTTPTLKESLPAVIMK
jgi:uncharacterized protein YegL